MCIYTSSARAAASFHLLHFAEGEKLTAWVSRSVTTLRLGRRGELTFGERAPPTDSSTAEMMLPRLSPGVRGVEGSVSTLCVHLPVYI